MDSVWEFLVFFRLTKTVTFVNIVTTSFYRVKFVCP